MKRTWMMWLAVVGLVFGFTRSSAAAAGPQPADREAAYAPDVLDRSNASPGAPLAAALIDSSATEDTAGDDSLETAVPASHPMRPADARLLGVLVAGTPLFVAALAASQMDHGGLGGGTLLAGAVGLGVVVGPAVAQSSAGWGDRAARGVAIRTLGLLGVGTGLLGAAVAFGQERVTTSTSSLMSIGVAGAAVTAISFVYDLAVIPSRHADQAARVGVGLRPDGMVAAIVRF